MRRFSAAVTLVAGFAACSSNEIGNSKDVAQGAIFQEYRINCTEGDEKAVVMAQFRFGGKNGTTLVLNSPSGISLDGTPVKVDSSGMAGAFYKVAKPVEAFYGTHRLSFTDITGKRFENDFVFDRFALVNPPARASASAPLVLQFDSTGLKPGDEITIQSIGTDSSFSAAHTVSSGSYTATIPAAELKRQKTKELQLEITLTRNVPLQQLTQEGGELYIHYALKPLKVALGKTPVL